MRKSIPALLIVLLAGCSTNPATGNREFNIVSESQEIAIGRQSHPEILREFGVYDEKPELNRMVDRIGRRIAAGSDRPNLPWTFTVLDSPMVNAMALPGGYIYITRGMLERINSEDELAGVLGHEIAHVTARHSAQQISRSQVAQLGLVLGSVVAGPQVTQNFGQLAELGLGLLFQKYSRAQESQADQFGTRYMARAQFNPIGSERMLRALVRLDKNRSSGIDRYFMSHPDPVKRVRDVQKTVAELGGGMMSSADVEPPNRAEYVRLLDGIITGNSTEHTVIRNNVIYDRAHGLVVRPPRGWVATAPPGVIFAMSPSRDEGSGYFVAQEIPATQLQGRNAQEAVRLRLQQMGLQYLGARESRLGSGERFALDVWQGQTQNGTVGVETTQFPHGDHVAVLMFVGPSVGARSSPLSAVMEQIQLNPSQARSTAPPRMRVGTVRSGETWADLARRSTGRSGDAEIVANINGFDLRTPPPVGLAVKLPEEVAEN